ncbi:MAG: hypothetical protein IJU29_08430 [Oscillospiraceae bacterium]|nr:hypothetical protein [Oscillospiraceae bacterium]
MGNRAAARRMAGLAERNTETETTGNDAGERIRERTRDREARQWRVASGQNRQRQRDAPTQDGGPALGSRDAPTQDGGPVSGSGDAPTSRRRGTGGAPDGFTHRSGSTSPAALQKTGRFIDDFAENFVRGGMSRTLSGVYGLEAAIDETVSAPARRGLYAFTGDEKYNEPYVSSGRKDSLAFAQDADEIWQRTSAGRNDAGKKLMGLAQNAGSMVLTGMAAGVAGAQLPSGLSASLGAAAESYPALSASAAGRAASALTRTGARLAGDLLANPANALISAQAAGSTYVDARERGAEPLPALENAIGSGMLEYETNKLFSGMPFEDAPGQGYAARGLEYLADKTGTGDALRRFSETVPGRFAGYALDKLGEAAEEYVDAWADPYIERYTWNPDAALSTPEERREAAEDGFLLSLLLGAGDAAVRGMDRAGVFGRSGMGGAADAASEFGAGFYSDTDAAWETGYSAAEDNTAAYYPTDSTIAYRADSAAAPAADSALTYAADAARDAPTRYTTQPADVMRTRPADDAAVRLARTDTGDRTDALMLGIPGGQQGEPVRQITNRRDLTETMRMAEAIAKTRGLNAVFFAGGNLTVDGQPVNGVLDGNTVYLRADDLAATSQDIVTDLLQQRGAAEGADRAGEEAQIPGPDALTEDGGNGNIAAERERTYVGRPTPEAMRARAGQYRNVPRNNGVIAEQIANGNYSLNYKHQKYLQHVRGTAQYQNAMRDRRKPQSFLAISEQEAREIVYQYAGTGTTRLTRNGDIMSREYVTVYKPIGEYYDKGGWHKTNRVEIIYSARGVHIVPVFDKHETS